MVSDKKFDVVIIGGGLGGLLSALLLLRKGLSVCVLEKNRQFGGCLQIFSRHKRIFDTGIHYIGSLDKGQNLYKIFKYLGIYDELNLLKMDAAYDKIYFEDWGVEYNHIQGYENFTNYLLKLFPDESDAIHTYFNTIKRIVAEFPLYNLKLPPKELTFSDAIETDTSTFINSITNNKKLRAIFAGANLLYAGVADKTPLYVHALISDSYISSSWKCVNGGAQIEKALTKKIKVLGGIMINHAKVEKLIVEDGKATSVKLASGQTVYGTNFISNIHPSNTLDLIEPGAIRKAYVNRIQQLENGASVFIVYLALKKDAVPFMNYNTYYYVNKENIWTSHEYTEEEWPKGIAIFSPANAKSTMYADSLIVMSYMHYDEVKQWEETYRNYPVKTDSRSAEYEEFKKNKAEKIIALLVKKIPEVDGNINGYDTSTPLTFRDYIGTKDGSMYGIMKDYKSPLKTFLHPKTKIPNLYLTGQNLNVHGVVGVSMSALVTTHAMVGMEKEIKAMSKVN